MGHFGFNVNQEVGLRHKSMLRAGTYHSVEAAYMELFTKDIEFLQLETQSHAQLSHVSVQTFTDTRGEWVEIAPGNDRNQACRLITRIKSENMLCAKSRLVNTAGRAKNEGSAGEKRRECRECRSATHCLHKLRTLIEIS